MLAKLLRGPHFFQTTNNIRPYSLSRFPKRIVGTGRIQRPQSKLGKPLENVSAVDILTGSETSATTAPINHPGDSGLTRLLMYRDTLVIERQLEMLNVFIGFEQSNKYTISTEDGEPLGFIAEDPRGFWGTLSRQAFSTHRPFRAVIMDKDGAPVLWLRRPFAWISSRMFVQRLKDHSDSPYEPEPALETFAEVQQLWHLWRRRYDLFLREYLPEKLVIDDSQQQNPQHAHYYQVGKVDSGFLAWEFRVLNERGEEIARVERAFRGIGREIFTDTGKYSVHFKASGVQKSLSAAPELSAQNISQSTSDELNIDARSLLLALAVNVDFDYFSRHSQAGGGGLFHMSTWE